MKRHEHVKIGEILFRMGEPRPNTTERSAWQQKAKAKGWEAAQAAAKDK